jgi:hypothetical protein
MMTLRSSDTKEQGGSDERGYTNRHRPGKEHFPFSPKFLHR